MLLQNAFYNILSMFKIKLLSYWTRIVQFMKNKKQCMSFYTYISILMPRKYLDRYMVEDGNLDLK